MLRIIHTIAKLHRASRHLPRAGAFYERVIRLQQTNVAFASAPAQLFACVSAFVQQPEGPVEGGLPIEFSPELHRSFAKFRQQRWRFYELLPLAIQLDHVRSLQADDFLDELEQFLTDGGRLDEQRFADFFVWAPDLKEQMERFGEGSFREKYMHVLRRTWAELHDPWRETGLPETKQIAAEWTRHMTPPSGAGPLFADNLFALNPFFSEATERAAERGSLRIIPLWAVPGGFYVPDGDEVYIGFAPEAVQFVERVEERAERLSEAFAALSNKTRVRMMFLLSEQFPETVGDIALQLNLPHSNVSTHLKVLQRAGLVRVERSGVRTLVTRNEDAVTGLKQALNFHV